MKDTIAPVSPYALRPQPGAPPRVWAHFVVGAVSGAICVFLIVGIPLLGLALAPVLPFLFGLHTGVNRRESPGLVRAWVGYGAGSLLGASMLAMNFDPLLSALLLIAIGGLGTTAVYCMISGIARLLRRGD